jgi:2-polyprenyl-3-methyl-5-hydroxy-6-metoxy-1,4-benzoquinol methylase
MILDGTLGWLNLMNRTEWIETTCDWCGTQGGDLVFEGPDRLEGLPGNFFMVKCSNCGIFRQNPRLPWESLAEYYPENYAAYEYTIGDKKNWLRSRIDNYGNYKRRRAIERFIPNGSLLEIGCGTGAFLNELLHSGNWDVVGIEPSEKAAAYTKEVLNIPVHQGRFEDIHLDPETFDVVVLWCVVEHLTDPIQDLRRAQALLKEGGWLIFSMPNYESWDAKIFGKYWAGWDLPRHLYVFPRKSLRDVLKKIGFENISEKCLSTSYHALGHNLEFWSQSWDERKFNRWQFVLRLYRTWMVRILLLLPLAVLDRLKLATNITIFAQKVTISDSS